MGGRSTRPRGTHSRCGGSAGQPPCRPRPLRVWEGLPCTYPRRAVAGPEVDFRARTSPRPGHLLRDLHGAAPLGLSPSRYPRSRGLEAKPTPTPTTRPPVAQGPRRPTLSVLPGTTPPAGSHVERPKSRVSYPGDVRELKYRVGDTGRDYPVPLGDIPQTPTREITKSPPPG